MEKLDKEDKDMLIESVPGGANNVEFDKKKSSTNINIYRASVDDRTTTRKRVLGIITVRYRRLCSW